jgi:hypothetical protein
MDRFLAGQVAAHSDLQSQTRLRLHFLQEMPAGIRVWRTFIGEAWTNDTVRQIVRDHFHDQRRRFAAIIAEGRCDGTLTELPTLNDDLMASLLISLYDGLMFQWAVDPQAFSMEEYAEAMHRWLGLSALSSVQEPSK